MSEVLISVIIPVYNLENYINKCLSSVGNQTFENIEIIVIDDGSTDNSKLVINEHVVQDNRIIYIEKENRGVSSARNKGIEVAKGKYITFVDGDDYINPFMLEELISKAEKDLLNLVLCFHSSTSVDFLKIEDNTITAEEYIKYILEGKVPRTACGILYKLEIIKNNNLYFDNDLHYGEDMLFTIKFLLLSKNKVGICPHPFYIVGQREESAIRTMNIDQFEKIQLLAFKMEEVFKEAGEKDNFQVLLDKYFLFDIIYSISHIVNSKAPIFLKIKKLKEIKNSSHANNSLNIKFQAPFSIKLKASAIRLSPPIIIYFLYSFKTKMRKFLPIWY